MKIWSVMTLIVLIGLTVLPQVVQAQDLVAAARAQLTTARFHSAELAQRGTAVAGTQLHLRHVINCLEGPQGKNFTAASGNPCGQQGNGILVDLRAAAGAGNAKAEKALRFAGAGHAVALQGVVSNDVNEAQPYALVVAKQLDSALDALK